VVFLTQDFFLKYEDNVKSTAVNLKCSGGGGWRWLKLVTTCLNGQYFVICEMPDEPQTIDRW